MTSTLVFNARYPHSPERVWQALTHPQALAAWLMENDFEACVGHRFQFKEASLPGLETVIDCEVIALEPPIRLVYTWRANGMPTPSVVTWILMPIDGGTQLQLRHSGLTVAKSPLNAVSLLQRHSSPAQQLWDGPSAQLSVPAFPPESNSAKSLEPHTLLGPHTLLKTNFEEDEWNFRLNTALPEILTQLVTA